MKTPMFKYIIPPTGEVIKCFIYSRSKLVNYFIYPSLTTTLVQKDITPITLSASSLEISTNSDWAIEMTILHIVPVGAVIIIEVPADFLIKDDNCLNDKNGGSQVDSALITCQRISTSSQFKATIGNSMLANSLIGLRFGL
jgi:hypothetical protein